MDMYQIFILVESEKDKDAIQDALEDMEEEGTIANPFTLRIESVEVPE